MLFFGALHWQARGSEVLGWGSLILGAGAEPGSSDSFTLLVGKQWTCLKYAS